MFLPISEDCESIVLESGSHEYPFEFTIPTSAPSSFQGPYGHIKYYLSANLKRPKGKDGHDTKVPITVNGVLDLNHGSSTMGNGTSPSSTAYGGEVKKFTKKNMGFLTCLICLRGNNSSGSHNTGFLLRLPRTAFVPGEYIQFVADMRNMSGVDVSGVTLALIQVNNI